MSHDERAESELHSYSAYGLQLASALPLPELLPGKGRADVHIGIDRSTSGGAGEISGIRSISASPIRVSLTWSTVGDLLIEDGNRITVTPASGADEESLRLFVTGAGLGVLLHQRGLLVLHASGVVIEDRAVGFLGAKGWGKSTTAMALHQRGRPFISDELLVMRFDEQNQALVMPGSTPMRLWADALVSAGGNLDTATRVRPGVDKYYVNASSMADEEYPLDRLYLLDGGERLSAKPVPLAEAFFGIVPHVYVSRFGTPFIQSTDFAHTFRQLNLLLKKTAVIRLIRRQDLTELQDIAKLIEAHSLT